MKPLLSLFLFVSFQLDLLSQTIYRSAHLLIGKSKEQIIEAKGGNYELTNEGDITYDIDNPTGTNPQIVRYSFSETNCNLIAFFYKKKQLEDVRRTMNKLFSFEEVKLPRTGLYAKLWVETEGNSVYTWSLTDKDFLFYLTVMHYKDIGPGKNNQGKKPNISKEQTEEWIQGKLNKYITPSSIHCFNLNPLGPADGASPLTKCDDYSNIVFKFEDDWLIIACHVKETFGGQNEKDFDRTIKIPIYSLDNFFCTTNEISFDSDFKAFEEDDSNGESSKTTFERFYFNGDQEEKLADRLQTTFVHLKSLVKKPTSKEAF